MPPQFLRLESSAIDSTDEAYRMRRRHPAALRESIARSGIRSPLLVERIPGGGQERYRIISGWGRWLARREGEALPCFLLPDGTSPEEAWDMLLRDNDAWNVMEIARVLQSLKAVPGLDEDRIVAGKLPLLGLHASWDLHRRHLRLLDLGSEAQHFVEEEGLPLRKAMALFKLPPDAVELLLRASKELGLTFSDVGEAIELVEETAHREGVAAAALIGDVQGRASSRDEFRRALRERRYPELARYRERITELEREVHFTPPVRIEWDSRLERPGIRLVAELADADALAAFESDVAANREALRRLLEIV